MSKIVCCADAVGSQFVHAFSLRPYEDLREDVGEGNTLSAANNVPAVKYGMDLAGYHGGPVRSPLVDLSERDRSRAEEHYGRIDAEPSLEVI